MPIVEPAVDEAFVGIIPWEANLNQKAIERLRPPPGNAGILLRGGTGWVFGIEPPRMIEHPRIVHLRDEPPSADAVSLALARERARRWSQKRPPFATDWATPEGFRTQVRGPVHQYLTSFYDTHRALGSELGLGLSGVRLSTDGPIARDAPLNLILSSPLMTRWAFWMRMVLAYAKWRDRDRGSAYPTRPAGAQEDHGMGVAIFGSMKKLIVAMMRVGADNRDVPNILSPENIATFESNA